VEVVAVAEEPVSASAPVVVAVVEEAVAVAVVVVSALLSLSKPNRRKPMRP
jgi:hypothetical protein